MDWAIETGLRVDLVCYAGSNLNGKRSVVQIFPGGNRKGDVDGAELASLVVRARHGTRLVLVTEPGPDWQDSPWRCIRMVEGRTVPSERRLGMPGVRIPDLDLADPPNAKRTSREMQSTYPSAARLGDSDHWTYGRIGGIKKRVVLIRIERDVAPTEDEDVIPETDALARQVLLGAREEGRPDLPALTEIVAKALAVTLDEAGHGDAEDRVQQLLSWAETLED